MMGNMGFGGHWMMIGWFVILVACVFLFAHLFNTGRKLDSNGSSLEKLKKRYAEGFTSGNERTKN